MKRKLLLSFFSVLCLLSSVMVKAQEASNVSDRCSERSTGDQLCWIVKSANQIEGKTSLNKFIKIG